MSRQFPRFWVAWSQAAVTIALLASCAIAVLSCGGGAPPFLDVLWSDCDTARDYKIISMMIRTQEDVGVAFRATGEEKPIGVSTVLDAKIFFARRSFEEGCEWSTHAGVVLADLLLRRGDVREAIQSVKRSISNSPTLDGYEVLARCYDAAGEARKAASARKRAESFKGEWD